MKQVPIGDCVVSVRKWNPAREASDQWLDYIDIASVSQTEKAVTGASRIIGSDAPSRARQVVAAGDVLVSTVRPNLNAVAAVPDQHDGATASTGFAVLRPRERRLNGRYLYHWVRTPDFVTLMIRQSTGQSYPAVSEKIIKETSIPLPPLEEQRRIAAILDQADALRRLRHRTLTHLNTLAQSIFHEMFGDLEINSKGWGDGKTLGDIADIASGITKGRKTNGKPTREVPYLAVANVQYHLLKLDNVKTIDATDDEIERYHLDYGDILLTEGGDPDKLGRGTLWRNEIPDCIHQNHIFRVRLQCKNFRPIFVNWIIGSDRGKRYFLRSAKQTTGIASINKTQLKEFPLLCPPVAVQEKFEQRLAILANRSDEGQAAIQKTEDLFTSLQHRAFRGEL